MDDEEFFVGYLDTPPRTKRFALGLGVGLVLLAAGIASAAAYFQRSPGAALERSQRTELTGLWLQQPYPHLRYRDEETGEIRHALTARGHKAGLGDAYAELDGKMVTVGGQLYRRAGGGLLVVFRAPRETEGDPASLALEEERRGDVQLEGEIVDSKCFYGQMRPGDGRAHRPCAQLCIRGGIPPVLVVHEGDDEMHYVLTSNGGALPIDVVMEYLAEPVRIAGNVTMRGTLRMLSVARIDRR